MLALSPSVSPGQGEGAGMSISTRAPMLPMAASDRRSLNFVSDQLTDGFRVLRSFAIAPRVCQLTLCWSVPIFTTLVD